MALIEKWSATECEGTLSAPCTYANQFAEFDAECVALSKAASFPGVKRIWAVLNTKTKSGVMTVKALTGAEVQA
jgi:hypothetical protein